jgi:hypothetical protein
MRKDVECTFGILKKRFKILDHGVNVKSIHDVDKVWQTCCSLHNMILESDGLDEFWDDGEDVNCLDAESTAIRRLNDLPITQQEVVADVEAYNDEYESFDGFYEVHKMNQVAFKKRLIDHFDIKFKKIKLYGQRDSQNLDTYKLIMIMISHLFKLQFRLSCI